MRLRPAFTLLELLLVVGIIGVLASVVIVAIHPSRQLAKARNAQRRGNIRVIVNAAEQYSIENGGNVPTGIDTTLRMIGTAASGCSVSCGASGSTTAAGCLNLSPPLVSEYLPAIPEDPSQGSAAKTYYAITEDNRNRLTVRACAAELGETIQVTR